MTGETISQFVRLMAKETTLQTASAPYRTRSMKAAMLLLTLVLTWFSASINAAESRPNILLLVADDLGYSDLGSYGGDISTPNIDALAGRGVRFTQFHTAPLCAPTRAMLLSGNDNHTAGMGIQGEGEGPLEGLPGYEGHLSDRVIPFPVLLKDAGYHTYIVGKWHLGLSPEHSPTAAGFERCFTLLHGAGDHFSDVALEPSLKVSPYWEDGRPGRWPEGRYSTDLYTERLIDFISDDIEDGKPFFAFAAYTSPHWPLQVPEEYLHRYKGRYDMGYDRLREMRFESLKKARIVPAEWERPPRLESITPWESLSDEERRREARKMELYAAMVENLDHHIGRLLSFLDERGQLDNTVVVFMADNGAAAEDFYNQGPFVDWLQSNYDNAYQYMGTPRSYVSYGPQWAEAGSAPFRAHKGHATEGGITAPMIVAGPGIRSGGSINRSYVSVMDLAPTFLELAGANYPGSHGTSLSQPIAGRSALALFRGDAARVHDESEVLGLALGGRAYVRQGNWKLVSIDSDRTFQRLQLFNLALDPGETVDRSTESPDRYQEMIKHWQAFQKRVGVYVEQPAQR
jgi:arylsulfatase